MIRVCDNGHPPARLESGTPCRACERRREASRPSRQERGYGADHYRARRALAAALPQPCAYCHVEITSAERWVAAHVRDGDSSSPRMVAHLSCNARYRGRGIPDPPRW
jgi:hypothetical protein